MYFFLLPTLYLSINPYSVIHIIFFGLVGYWSLSLNQTGMRGLGLEVWDHTKAGLHKTKIGGMTKLRWRYYHSLCYIEIVSFFMSKIQVALYLLYYLPLWSSYSSPHGFVPQISIWKPTAIIIIGIISSRIYLSV